MQLIAANVAAGAQFFFNYNIAAAANAAIPNANSSWRNSAITNGLFITQTVGGRAVADTSTEEAEQRQLPLFDEFGGKQCRSFSTPAKAYTSSDKHKCNKLKIPALIVHFDLDGKVKELMLCSTGYYIKWGG